MRLFFLVWPLAGCARPPLSTPATAVEVDLETLCSRAEARDMSTWSQPAYLSEEVRRLTYSMDEGSDEARCALGRLMESTRRQTECPEALVAELMAVCEAENP